MGVSAIEQIYLPNCLCASGIKPSKFRKSERNWGFKLARSTYAQWPRASPRTPPGITANAAEHHRERRRAPPRADTAEQPRCFPWARPLPTANGPGYHRERPGHHRERCRGITANSPSPRAPVLSAGPAAPHPHHSLEPCRSTPASFP